jgi:hypothetical protein
MTGPKLVLVVLVLFAVLFIAGLGLGLRGEGSGLANVDWIETLSGALTPHVDVDALQGPCLDPAAKGVALERRATCQVSIPSAAAGTRRIALTLSEGRRVEVRYQAPPTHDRIDNNDEMANQVVALESGKTPALVILKEGGSLTFTACDAPDGVRCQIGLE